MTPWKKLRAEQLQRIEALEPKARRDHDARHWLHEARIAYAQGTDCGRCIRVVEGLLAQDKCWSKSKRRSRSRGPTPF
jgi:hypothetical protein